MGAAGYGGDVVGALGRRVKEGCGVEIDSCGCWTVVGGWLVEVGWG